MHACSIVVVIILPAYYRYPLATCILEFSLKENFNNTSARYASHSTIMILCFTLITCLYTAHVCTHLRYTDFDYTYVSGHAYGYYKLDRKST